MEAPAGVVARVRTALLAHFDVHRRDLPWRRQRDPYAIWVSEVMLQQTRVDTVAPYYQRFLTRFPTPRALADASVDSVLSAWAGLGYYRRARMLHAGARAVTDVHGGVVPSDPIALRALPGIGAYTAGAIASIAFGLREAIVDGNVERVLTRVFAMPGDPRATGNRKRIWSLAARFADCDRPGDLNQALMELGATVCSPVAPRCSHCPVRAECSAHARGEPERFPEKRARAAVREEEWCALVAIDAARRRVWLEPSEIGRWNGMLLPPMVQSDALDDAIAGFAGGGVCDLQSVGAITHVLTHAAMRVSVVLGRAPRKLPRGRMVPLSEFDQLAVPKITRVVVERALKK